MTIPSKVISKENREALAKALATIAMKDQFAVIRSHLIKASDAVLPLYDQVMDELEGASPMIRQFVSCGTADDIDLSEDYRYPLKSVKDKIVYEYNSKAWVDEVLDNSDVNYPTSCFDLPDDSENRPDWLEDILEETRIKVVCTHDPFRFWSLNYLEMLSNRYVKGRYNNSISLTKTQCSMIRGAIEELAKANIHSSWLQTAYNKLANEIEENITEARTTKKLVEAWPECEPLLEYLYPTGSSSSVETPLGNIVLRHVQALPSPQEAA